MYFLVELVSIYSLWLPFRMCPCLSRSRGWLASPWSCHGRPSWMTISIGQYYEPGSATTPGIGKMTGSCAQHIPLRKKFLLLPKCSFLPQVSAMMVPEPSISFISGEFCQQRSCEKLPLTVPLPVEDALRTSGQYVPTFYDREWSVLDTSAEDRRQEDQEEMRLRRVGRYFRMARLGCLQKHNKALRLTSATDCPITRHIRSDVNRT